VQHHRGQRIGLVGRCSPPVGVRLQSGGGSGARQLAASRSGMNTFSSNTVGDNNATLGKTALAPNADLTGPGRVAPYCRTDSLDEVCKLAWIAP